MTTILSNLLLKNLLGLTLYQTTNLYTGLNSKHLQTKNRCDLKTEFLSGIGRKHCGKRRKCWLPAFSPFPTMFLKDFCSESLKVGISWLELTKTEIFSLLIFDFCKCFKFGPVKKIIVDEELYKQY